MSLGQELEGVLVVSLEQAVAAPYCGLLLADAGARVIKVERAEGDFARKYDTGADGNSAIFAWLNRGKESVVLDIGDKTDAAQLTRMLQKADVFLHNLAPGALERKGFGVKDLKRLNPKLINVQISGYGADGDGAKMKAYDFLVQAESGVCDVTGTPGDPCRVGLSICDIGTGLTAFSAVLRALIKQGRTGKGSYISIAMFDVLADWMNMPLMAERYMASKPKRMGLTHALLAPYGAYKTGDGHQILISIQSNREWAVFCDKILDQAVLGTDPRFLNNADRVANRTALDVYVNAVFGSSTKAVLMQDLGAANIAYAQLSTVKDLSAHKFLRNLSVNFSGTEIKLADLPVETENARKTEVPVLGQHNAQIRAEFGESE